MKLKGLFILVGGLALGVLLGLVVVLSGPGSAGVASQRNPPTVGSPVRDFTLQGTDGKTYRLSELKGTPLVINFWATWCPPCIEEMPLLERVAQQYAGRLLVLGVDNGEEADVITRFAKTTGVTFPLLMDKTGDVSDLYYVHNFPTTFFVDQDGILRAQHLGLLTESGLARYLKSIGMEEP